jgi:hypothetical protein
VTDGERAVAETRAWVQHAVVGLTFCPFAKAPLQKGLIRFALCESDDPGVLLAALCDEMALLVRSDPADLETTLLIHPNALPDFRDFNDFLAVADGALEEAGLAGVLQIASFHPRYRFAGTRAGDIGNATNRSPHPTLHLLREASIDRAVEAFPDAAAIVEANLRTLGALGPAGWAVIQTRIRMAAGS